MKMSGEAEGRWVGRQDLLTDEDEEDSGCGNQWWEML